MPRRGAVASTAVAAVVLLVGGAVAFRVQGGPPQHPRGVAVRASSRVQEADQSRSSTVTTSRRGILEAVVATTLAGVARPALAADDPVVDVYFGVGCFWHVQHELAAAERKLLGRADDALTATAGYAGGLATGRDASRPDKPNLVCYHNLQRVADYGKLGHGEVVGLRVPASSVGAFAQEYAALFDARGDRPDKLDIGPEYRSILGLPGGIDSPLFRDVEPPLAAIGLSLKPGKGNEPDTLGKKVVFVYDSDTFPAHQAEIYHQFHDGFMPGENYPPEYNALNLKAFKAGRLADTGCPDII